MIAIHIILGAVIGVVASYLLGLLLVEKETLREMESQYEDTHPTSKGKRTP